ncbi:hypothetical protein BGW38_000743 [Lunasporangiospora selenospora]|uniref:Uncharacterized protein n=1 Tax=Lunasporangiospora selenospora TaxID=979761 RepID=A0A9P6FUP5_9FUNG|nr:hypothetical protein BGW38_000743 [Lunasporangiospora selenospora]
MPSSNRRSMMPTPPNGIKDNKGTSKSRRHKNGGDSASSSRPMSPASDMTVLHDDLFLFSPMSDPSSSTTPTSNTLSMTSSTSTKGPGSSSAASTMTSLSSASFEYNLKKIRKLSIFNGSKPSPHNHARTVIGAFALALALGRCAQSDRSADSAESRAVTPSLQEPVSTPCPIPEIEIQMDTTVESLVEEISAMLSQRPCSRMSGRSSVGSARPEGSMNPSRSPTPVIYGRAGDKEEILEDDDPPTNKLEGPGPPPALMSVPMIPPSLYNRSWTLYKTTPFFGFDPSQFTTYEDELLNYLAANAKNLVAEAQTGIIPAGGAMASEATGHRFNPSFYGFDTAELSGDIKKIDFRMLSLVADDDDSEQENEEEDKVRKGNRGVDKLRDSLFVTLTVRPKGSFDQLFLGSGDTGLASAQLDIFLTGQLVCIFADLGRVREQEYYYAVLLDQDQDHTSNTTSGFTYFNILLHKAPLAITRLVYEWFERKFDCRICRLSFQSYEFRRVVNESLEVLYGPENTHDRAGK